MNQLTTLRWSLDEDIKRYQAWNLPAIGISWRKLCEYGVQSGIRAIQKSGLTVSNVGWVGGFTGLNGYGLEEVMLEAKRAIRVACQLKAPTVTVLTGPQNGHIGSHANRLATESVLELANLADIYQVRLAIQPMHPVYYRDWSFLHSVDDALALIDRIGHPAVGLACGSYHLCDEAAFIEKMVKNVDLIQLVMLADRSAVPSHNNDRMIPGEGQLPLAKMIAELENAGYSGWYETEVWSRELWKMDHDKLIERCLKSQQALF